ncbi:solute carrier family 22 member 15-like isoform X2 [Lineus longissimus]
MVSKGHNGTQGQKDIIAIRNHINEQDGENGGPTFENHVLDAVGHFGSYQRWVFAVLTMTDIPSGMCMLYFIFSNANPGTRCSLFEGNKTYENNFTIGGDIACVVNGSKCVQFEYKSDYSSIVTEWDLVCGRDYIPDLTITIQFIGLIIGATTTGQLADSYGRKKLCLFSLMFMMLSQTLVGFSGTWEIFAATRFFVGVFAAGAISLSVLLPMEIIGPKWRPFCAALGIYSVGHAIMCLLAYLTTDWRRLALATGILSSPLIFAVAFFVPESPRWLIQKSRFDEAEAIIVKMATFNKKRPPDMAGLKEVCTLEGEDKEKASRYTYLDLFTTKKFAVRTLVILFICFSASEIYYGIIVQISSFTGDIYLNALISALITLPAGWAVIPVASWFGRKKSFLLFNVIGGTCMFLIIILNRVGYIKKNPRLLTGLALGGKSAIVGMWTIASLSALELFPTLMRALGCGAGNIAARVGGMLAPQFGYLGILVHWTLPYIIHGCLAVGCAILEICFLPETNNMPLPENPPPISHRPGSRPKKVPRDQKSVRFHLLEHEDVLDSDATTEDEEVTVYEKQTGF